MENVVLHWLLVRSKQAVYSHSPQCIIFSPLSFCYGQQAGASNAVLLSSFVHDDVTYRLCNPEKEAFPRFWGQRYSNQSINALCANDRFTHKRHHKQCEQQAWKGVNQVSSVEIWRTVRLWLEFSIRVSTIHHVTQKGMMGYPPFLFNRHLPSTVSLPPLILAYQ